MVELTGSHPLPDPRDQNLSPRDRILAAAMRLLATEGDEVVLAGLSRKRLATLTGYSRQTLYRHFPDDGSLLEALVHEVLAPDHAAWSVEDLAAGVGAYLLEESAETEALLRDLARLQYQELAGDEYWPPWLALWALARHRAEVGQNLAQSWGWLVDQLEGVYEVLLEAWDSTLVPPWTTRRVAHVLGSLVEGMTLRGAVLGEEVDADLFADAVVAFVQTVVRSREGTNLDPGGDPGDASGPDGAAAPDPPGEAVLPDRTGDRPDALDLAELTRVVAVTLDASRGNRRLPSLSDIAEQAGIPVARLRATFEGRDVLAGAVGQRLVAQVLRHANSLDPDDPPLVRLRTHLEAVARLALEYPALAEYLHVLAISPTARQHSTAAHLADEVAHPVEVLLRQARNRGQLTYSVTSATLARHLVDVLMDQVLLGVGTDVNGPGRASAVVDMTWRLTLAGPVQTDPPA